MLEIGTHLIVMHRQVAHLIELWPDGGMVALDEELEPDMFLDGRG